MVWRLYFATALALGLSQLGRGADFPYTAYTNSADVYVRSGPGRDYYPTDKLRKGEKVEVYRHDPGGWLAIRPPRQSFSWVASRHVDDLENGLGVLNQDRVVARVGSQFSDVRDIIQVRLERGEKVELIGPSPGGSPWCKIAPPSGEFRWVFSKYVDRDGEAAADIAEDDPDSAGQGEAGAGANPKSVRLASAAGKSRSPDEAARAAENARTGGRELITGEAAQQRELDHIELDTSMMLAADITAWSFAELKRRTEAILEHAQTAVERGQARILLDKLARFDEIRQRHDALHGPTPATERSNSTIRPAATRADDPRFDGVGRLSPVVSQKAGGPQYALVDATNAVVSFVTAAPGVNLRPYVDKQVGVNGQRGYLTDLQRQHINVQRVTLLELPRR